jgi:hypothetical protein
VLASNGGSALGALTTVVRKRHAIWGPLPSRTSPLRGRQLRTARERAGTHAQGVGEPNQRDHAEIGDRLLDPLELPQLQVGALGELRLAQASHGTPSAYVGGEAGQNVAGGACRHGRLDWDIGGCAVRREPEGR